MRDDGIETIMVNCNPETVSTDYDTSDRLYFEPLTFEDVMAIYEHEAKGTDDIGVIVQFGGQTPLNLALPLKKAGVKIIGTSPESIDLAEDRKRFEALLSKLDIPQSPGGMATSVDEALAAAEKVGYPVLVRPSYVLGGRAMVIAYDAKAVKEYMGQAVEYSQDRPDPGRSLSGGGDRGGRGRLERRRGRGDCRDHGAHRRGGNPLGRFLVRIAQCRSIARGAGNDPRVHLQAGQGAERGGTDEHSVCHPAREGLRDRGEPAGVAHGARMFPRRRAWPAPRLRRG